MQGLKIVRNPITWGLGALVLAAVVSLVAAYLYISPTASQTVAFYTVDASSVRPGDDVRIAGITVGKVKDLSFEPERVRIRATVDRSALVGDQSQVQVRMLTAVGGYYVNIVSLGERSLGSAAIPLERVTMPYNLAQALVDSTKLTQDVNAPDVGKSLDRLQQGLVGTNVEALSALIDAGNTLTDAIAKQRGQVSSILEMSNEYVQALSQHSDLLKDLVGKLAIIEQTLTLYSRGFMLAYQGLGQIGDAFAIIGEFYMNHRDKFLQKVVDWQQVIRSWADRSGKFVQWLRGQRAWMERILDAQNAPPELLATDLCIPLAEIPC